MIRVSQSRALVACMPALLLGACSTGGQKLTHSGFLPDYAQLQKPAKKKNVAVWVSPDYRPERYQQVVIEPVEWRAPPRDAKAEKQLGDALHEHLVTALSGRYQVVEGSQVRGDALRVRSAITGVRRTRWFLNAPLQVATLAAGGLGVLAPLRGGGSVEIQIDDAGTQRPVLQLATYRNGQPWNIKGSYVGYNHAEQAFEGAAAQLVGYLDGTSAAPTPGASKAKTAQ